MKYLLLLALISCGHYTDPSQDLLTYYMCENKHEILVKRSDDYESIAIRYNANQQVTLHHFVNERGTGYRTENLLWLTQGKKAKLIEKLPDGTEKVLFAECVSEKFKLEY